MGLIASTFTFDAGFFEEELLSRFLTLETSQVDGRLFLAEREERLGSVPVVVLVDRRSAERSKTLAWDLLPVPAERGACQHSKITVLAWENYIRLIISSANLTEPAYRRNLEVYGVIDVFEGCGIPRNVISKTLRFLDLLIRQVPDPGGTAAPVARAQELLRTIRRLSRTFRLPDAPPRGSLVPYPIFLEPKRGPGVIEEMGNAWPPCTRPNEAWLCAPFWAENAWGNANSLINSLLEQMGSKGDRVICFLAPGEETEEGSWKAFLPQAYGTVALPRVPTFVHAVPVIQDRENRPLHAKMIRWRRVRGRTIECEAILIGSSNMTSHGLGLGGREAGRNFEANLCYVSPGDRKCSRWFDDLFPAMIDASTLEDAPERDAEEGYQAHPLPMFFGWAVLASTGSGAEIRIGLGGVDEPIEWRLEVGDGGPGCQKTAHHDNGSPPIITLPLPEWGPDQVAPTSVKVHWTENETDNSGVLPINAWSQEERCRPDLWTRLDLATLLEILASGVGTWRVLRRVLRRENHENESEIPVELDPHRKVDTSGFLLQRMRRIGRALDGLQERLSQPVTTRAGLTWRLSGPLSPGRIARILVDSTSDAEERGFLLAEIILTVDRARRAVSSPGLPRAEVQEAFAEARDELIGLLSRAKKSRGLRDYLETVIAGEPT